jgi:hypothetical protein
METSKKSWQIEPTEKVEEAAYNDDARAQTVLGYLHIWSPLVTAAEKGNVELAEFCLRMGADPFIPKIVFNHAKDKHVKITPLDIAQKNGHTTLAVLLKQAEKGRFFGKVKSLFNKFNA